MDGNARRAWLGIRMQRKWRNASRWLLGLILLFRTTCISCGTETEVAPKQEETPSASFNWGAAGFKKPVVGGWECKTCMVRNKDTT